MYDQLHNQRNWINDFRKEKKRLWSKYDRAYETLELKPRPADVETLNLKSIDATDVASLRTLSLKTSTNDKKQLEVIPEDGDTFQQKQLKRLNDLVETSIQLQEEINEEVNLLETHRKNRRFKSNLDTNIAVWDEDIKKKIFEKRAQAEKERQRKQKLEESKKADDTLLEIDLEEVITGKIKYKKKPKAV